LQIRAISFQFLACILRSLVQESVIRRNVLSDDGGNSAVERQLAGATAENVWVCKAVDLEGSLPLFGSPCSEKPYFAT